MRTGGLLGPSEGKTGVNYVMNGREEQTEGSSPNQEVGEFQGQSWVCPGSALTGWCPWAGPSAPRCLM